MVYLPTIGRSLEHVSWAFALVVLTAACIPDEDSETANTPTAAGKTLTKEQQGDKLIAAAKKDLDDEKFAGAREKLKEASVLDFASQRVAIADLRDQVDRGQAKRWAQDTLPKFKANDCASALRMLHDPLAALGQSEVFANELRRLVSKEAHACVDEAVDVKLRAGAYAAAREYLSSDDIKTVLGNEPWKKLVASVDMTIVEALWAKVDKEGAGHSYTEAVKRIEVMKKSGEATAEQASQLQALLREAAATDLPAQAMRAKGQPDAANILQKIDQAIASLGWTLADAGSEGGGGGEDAPPAEVVKARAELAASMGAGSPKPARKKKR
jgi:hypothetical protein